jgi:hypothetical protein
MPERSDKQQIITFKAEPALVEAMGRIGNRSQFIRAAILAALDSVCPLCSGSGVLSPNQRRHWDEFAENHSLEQCDECHEVRVVCSETGP